MIIFTVMQGIVFLFFNSFYFQGFLFGIALSLFIIMINTSLFGIKIYILDEIFA